MKSVRRRLLIHEKEVEWLPPRQVIVLIMTEMVSEHLYESSWAIVFDDAVLLFEIFLSQCHPMIVLGRCLLIRSAGSIMAAASSKLLFFSVQVAVLAMTAASRQQQVKSGVWLECNNNTEPTVQYGIVRV